VPGPLSKEALLVLVQGCLLVSRTLLTDYISRVEGYAGKAITSLVSYERRLARAAAAAGMASTYTNLDCFY
jgi:hypothetical protein